MAIISFALTAPQFVDGTKTVTRRDWSDKTLQLWQKWYDAGKRRHQGWSKSPRNGGRKIGEFYLTHRPFKQRIDEMSPKEFDMEGVLFAVDTPEKFADLVGMTVDDEMVVIRFARLGLGDVPLDMEILSSRGVVVARREFDNSPAHAIAVTAATLAIESLFPEMIGDDPVLFINDLIDTYKYADYDNWSICAHLENIRPIRNPWKLDFNNPDNLPDLVRYRMEALVSYRMTEVIENKVTPKYAVGDVVLFNPPFSPILSRISGFPIIPRVSISNLIVICGIDHNAGIYTTSILDRDSELVLPYQRYDVESIDKWGKVL